MQGNFAVWLLIGVLACQIGGLQPQLQPMPDYELVGTAIVKDTVDCYFRVTPHTLYDSGWVTIEFRDKRAGIAEYYGSLNFSDTVAYPTKVQYWQTRYNRTGPVESYWVDFQFWNVDKTNYPFVYLNVRQQMMRFRVYIELLPRIQHRGKYSVVFGDLDLDPWYSSDWLYRKSHVVNAAPGAGTYYTVNLTVHYGAGSDAGSHVYLGGLCQPDFDDLRFTDNDGTTLLSYWMQTYVASNTATVWVEIADNLNSSSATVYLYYGNAAASSQSDIQTTFLVADDFDDNSLNLTKWEEFGLDPGESFGESGGVLTMTDGDLIAGLTTYSGLRIKPSAWVTQDYNVSVHGLGFYWSDPVATIPQANWGFQFGNGTGWQMLSGFGQDAWTSQFGKNWSYVDDTVYSSGDYPLGNPATWDVTVQKNASYAWVYFNTTLLIGASQSGWFNETSIRYTGHSNNNYNTLTLNTFFVRKFVTPEPTHGAWGTVESQVIITWRWHGNGTFYVNGTSIANGSTAQSPINWTWHLTGAPYNASWFFLSFNFTSTVYVNPYNFTATHNETVWCWFVDPPYGKSGVPTPELPIAILLVGLCVVIGPIVAIGVFTRKKNGK